MTEQRRFAQHLDARSARDAAIDAARAYYEAETAPAWSVYLRVVGAAESVYDSETGAAWAAYKGVVRAALAAYDESVDAARDAE